MAPVFGVWRPIEPKLLRGVHNRLSRTGGCDTVWYEPSEQDANEVVAEIDPVAFLEQPHSSNDARLRVEFDLAGKRPYYWIHWWEPRASRGFGWHADETEPEYGPVHLQVEHPDGTLTRESADHIEDEHPYRTFERRLTSIPQILSKIDWK